MPPSLTLNDIADGAVRLIDRDGAARVTARNLGAELHVAAATLYTVVRSLDEVDAASRVKLIDRWRGGLDEVARQGSVIPFVTGIGHEEHNAVLYMTDPTRSQAGGSELVSRLFPNAADDVERADKQAIVYAIVATNQARSGLIEVALAAYDSARAGVAAVSLPAPAPEPDFDETVEIVLEEQISGERNQTLARVGLDLVSAGGVAEWVFRRVVDLSGVPLTTVHRAGDRLTHLRSLSLILGEAAWRRSTRVTSDIATSLGVAAREMQVGANPGLLAELQRPATDAPPSAEIVDSAAIGDDPLVAALPILTAVYVSRYARAGVAPDAWVEAPKLLAAIAASWAA